MCQFVFRMVRMVIWLALAVPLVTVAATVDVVKGWNLLGNSELTALNVATGLSDPGTVTTVWKWNRTAGTWALFSPSMTSAQLAAYAQTKGYDVLTSIASKESYWVNAVKAGTLTVSLEPPPQVGTPLLVLAASDLGVGWNLLASADGKNPSQFNAALVPNLNAVGKSIQTLWAWDAAGALWKFYSPILAAQGGKALSDYIAQKSYVAFDSAIGVTEGFWANVVTGVTNTTGTTTSTTSTSTTSRASTTAARTTTSTTIPVDTSQVFKDCASCPEMVVIPAGTFQMGSNNGDSYEQPVHSVNIRQFAIGKTEVTQAQWQAVMGSNPSEFKSCGSDCPVENVSWDDAQLFIQKLNANTGKQYRLPTEAEWEYAARAGGTGSWSFGNDATQLGQYAWYNANSGGTTHPVASKLANAFGLFDMYGNVWEWVQDTFHNNYNDAPNDGSAWVTASASSSPWVIRGGSWYYGPAEDRSTKRNVITPGYRSSHGFRVVLAIGQVFKDCASCPEMVVIPAGTFQMGSNNGDSYEQPVHSVNIRQFAIGKTEVTQAQWQAVMGSNPSEFKSCGSDCPVENVSWDDAQLFIQKLNANTGKQYRLPTEAEWEYAARAGGTGSWSFGNDATQLGQYAWYNANSGGTTHPVASKLANAFGLFDMYGNVWEWVQDTFHNNYNDAPNDGSAWVTASASSSPWVIRGGSWYYGPAEDRSTKRNVITPGYRSSHGFRVVLANMSKIATPDAYCGYGQWTTRAGSANEGHCASYGDNVQTKVLEEVNNRTDCGGYYKTLGMYSGNNLVAVQISNGNCRAATKDFPYAPPESLDTHCQKYGGTGTYRWAYSPTIQPFGGYGTLGVACEMPVTIN